MTHDCLIYTFACSKRARLACRQERAHHALGMMMLAWRESRANNSSD